MPLGAARITLLAFQPSIAVEAEVIRRKVGISAFGDAQVSTAQSQFGGASLLVGTAGSRLEVESYPAVGTSDFTYECWVYTASGATGSRILFDERTADTSENYVTVTLSNMRLQLFVANGFRIFTDILSTNTWLHFAVVRSNGVIKLYANGVQQGVDYTNAGSFDKTSIYIGSRYTNTQVFNGHIDEFRISNTARYTTTFTPQTQPHVNDANTLLLLHMDGTNASTFFEDDNGVRAPVGVTAVGDAQVSTAQSYFGGASYVGDGSGDYLNCNQPVIPESGDFTIELWFRREFLNSRQDLLSQFASVNGRLAININSNNTITAFIGGTGWPGASTTTSTVTTNTWHHIAYVRNGNEFKFYFNGVNEGATGTSSNNIYTGTNTFVGFTPGQTFFNGHIDEVRISNSARYTANFTPSTTAFENDDNTVLLLHMDGTNGSTVFRDDVGVRAPVGVSAPGATIISTAHSQFGGASAYFQASASDTRLLAFAAATGIGNGDFTIETWYRPTSLQSVNAISYINGKAFFVTSTGFLSHFDGSATTATTQQMSINNWYHLAWVRSSNTLSLYVNGNFTVSRASYTFSFGGNVTVGAKGINDQDMDGYLDEYRISNTARYTTNFAPATQPHVNDDNTLLLLHMDGTNGSTTFTDDTGVTLTHQYT